MTDIVAQLAGGSFVDFVQLFGAEEGRMGVAVTFIAVLELVREGLIDIVQPEPFAPLHVRAATAARRLRVVDDRFAAEEVLEAEVQPVDITRAPIAGMETAGFDDADLDDADLDEDDDDADVTGADGQ